MRSRVYILYLKMHLFASINVIITILNILFLFLDLSSISGHSLDGLLPFLKKFEFYFVSLERHPPVESNSKKFSLFH